MKRNIDRKIQQKLRSIGVTYYDGMFKDFLFVDYLKDKCPYEIPINKGSNMYNSVSSQLANFSVDIEAKRIYEDDVNRFSLKQSIEFAELIKCRMEKLCNFLKENKL